MGRTNKTYRNSFKNLRRELSDYKKVLRKKDQELFEEMFDKAEKNADAATYLNPRDPLIIAIISILLEQEKEINQIKRRNSLTFKVDYINVNVLNGIKKLENLNTEKMRIMILLSTSVQIVIV